MAEATLLPLFKFCSMNSGIVFCNGGPIDCLGERQECTSLSSCEAEICARIATAKTVVDIRNLCRCIFDSGHPLPDVTLPTVCAMWSYNMTLKGACHIELREKLVCEWVQDKSIKVVHITGKTNPAEIFTNEMQDGMHFRQLQDSLMSRLSDFLSGSILSIHHARQ